MKKRWIKWSTVLGSALLALSTVQSNVEAQDHGVQNDHQQTRILTLEGPAIHILVTEPSVFAGTFASW